jgi:hypothetical protein
MAHVFVIKRSNMRKDKIKNENTKENPGGLTMSRQISRRLSATSRICDVDIEEQKEEEVKITINPDEKLNDDSRKENTFEHKVDFENEGMKEKKDGTDDRDNQIGNSKEVENLEKTEDVGDLHKKTVKYVTGYFE